MPPDAQRFTTILNQTCGSGLTSYLTICKAIIIFPDFNWPVLSQQSTTEWAAFIAASKVIGTNPYFGFSRKIGAAGLSGYKTMQVI
jgi:hypothetical protein